MSENELIDPFNPPTISQEDNTGMPEPTQLLENGETAADKNASGETVVVDDDNPESISPPIKQLFGKELFDELFESVSGNPSKKYIEQVADSMESIGLVEEEIAQLDEIRLGVRETTNLIDTGVQLNNIHQQLLDIGGVNKDLVYSAESVSAGSITKHAKLNEFTHNVSLQGYDVSLESIGSRVMDIIKNVIKRILDGLRRIRDFVKGLFKGNDNTFTDPDLLLKKRQELIDMAVRLDSSFGRVAVSKAFGSNDPLALKTSTAREYVMAKIDEETLKTLKSHFTYSYYAICTNNILSNHVKKIKGVLNDQLKAAVQDANMLSSTPIDKWKEVKIDNPFNGLNSFTKEVNVDDSNKTPIEQLSDYQSTFNEKYKRIVNVPVTIKEFTKACVYSDPFTDWEDEQKRINKEIDGVESSIDKLQKSVDKLNTDGSYNVELSHLQILNQRISVCVQLITILNSHRSRFVSYHAKLATVLRVMDVRLKAVLLKNRLS